VGLAGRATTRRPAVRGRPARRQPRAARLDGARWEEAVRGQLGAAARKT
jgi:hypothetical protein